LKFPFFLPALQKQAKIRQSTNIFPVSAAKNFRFFVFWEIWFSRVAPLKFKGRGSGNAMTVFQNLEPLYG